MGYTMMIIECIMAFEMTMLVVIGFITIKIREKKSLKKRLEEFQQNERDRIKSQPVQTN